MIKQIKDIDSLASTSILFIRAYGSRPLLLFTSGDKNNICVH